MSVRKSSRRWSTRMSHAVPAATDAERRSESTSALAAGIGGASRVEAAGIGGASEAAAEVEIEVAE